MAALCHEHDALFVLDEVQTGVGLTGTAWAYQQLGLAPDVVAFGKKSQVCGVMAGGRVDEVPDNVFRVTSRINSTWGGNLTDMVRARRILEVIERDRSDRPGPAARRAPARPARRAGRAARVRDRPARAGADVRDARWTRPPSGATPSSPQMREREHVLILGTGERGIRFRPPLTVTVAELDAAVDALDRVLSR